MSMMRLWPAMLAAVLMIGSPVKAAPSQVNIYNWTDYIGETTLSDFQRATGIQPVYDIFDTNEVLETKLLTGHSGYDVVVPSSHFLGRQIEAGIFATLDRDLLPNYSNIDPAVLRHLQKVDPENTHAVPYLWGSSGLAYNKDMIKKVLGVDSIDSWSALFDPEIIKRLSQCGVAVMDSPDEVYGAAIHYVGGVAETMGDKEYEAATALLRQIRPYVTYFHSSKFVSDLANGEICIAMANSGDGVQAIARANEANNGVRIDYVVPKEGGNLWFDMLAIPADAKHKVEAHAFINFMLDPVNIAKVTAHTGYANPIPASKQYLPAEQLNNSAIYPSHAVLRRLYVSSPPPPHFVRAINRSWQSLKNGK